MSRIVRQTALSGLFGSKRFIVAVCAAIAMVLGALSVGASVFVPPSVVEGQEQAAQAPIFTERRSSNNASDTNSDGNVFTTQHTLVPNTLTQPKTTDKSPVKSTPKVKTALGIQFGPVDFNAGISLGTLQIKVDASVASPIADSVTEIIPTVEVPVTETPADEQTPEEPTSTSEDEKASPTETPSATTDASVQP
jgi:hypothetical protein